MKYSKDQVSDMLDNLKSKSNNETTFGSSRISASQTKTYCDRPNGEDAWTQGCEDAW